MLIEWDNYDEWKTSQYEECYYDVPEDDGYVHEDDLPDLGECSSAITDIVAMLYSNDKIDCAKLHECISFLADAFYIDTPNHTPNVERGPVLKNYPTQKLWAYQVELTKDYAKELTQEGKNENK